jgi:hypothetical protein
VISAEKFKEMKKAMTFAVKAGEYPMVDKDMTVVLPNHLAIVRYGGIDLTQVRHLKLSLGVAPNYFSGGEVEIYIDDENGRKIGAALMDVGLTSMGLKDLVIDLEEVSGKHDLVLKFKSKDTSKMFAALLALEFQR